MTKPLAKFIMGIYPDAPNKICIFFAPSDPDAQEFTDKLTQLKIPHAPLYGERVTSKNVAVLRNHKLKSEVRVEKHNIIQGAYIEGAENFALYRQHGGKIFDPEALKGVVFRTLFKGGIDIQWSQHMQTTLTRLGVDFDLTENGGRIVVNDPTSMAAIVYSNGKFAGSSRYSPKRAK